MARFQYKSILRRVIDLGSGTLHELMLHIYIIPQKMSIGLDDFRAVMDHYRTVSLPMDKLYFYHSDHLGSASWITDANGEAVQHLQYLPYGEPYINQRTTGYNERFTFTGKERDEETGYGYFGARYMDHELMTMWLSVDPLSDKYPSISPYAYCAWNPIKLVDPDGREVNYSSFTDWLMVSYQRIVNKDFRIRFDDLKASSEIYVFNGYYDKQSNGGELTTDGKKLYINYNICSNKTQGTNCFVNLRHETEHAVQFEYGEIGFDRSNNPNGNWDNSAINQDLMDEVNARDVGYAGFVWNSQPDENVRNSWMTYGVDNNQKKMSHLQESKAYQSWSTSPLNNTNETKIQTSTQYMLPHRQRPVKYYQ